MYNLDCVVWLNRSPRLGLCVCLVFVVLFVNEGLRGRRWRRGAGAMGSRPSLLEPCSPVPLPPLPAPQWQGDFPPLLLRQLSALDETAHAVKRAKSVVAMAPTPPGANSIALPHANLSHHHSARTELPLSTTLQEFTTLSQATTHSLPHPLPLALHTSPLAPNMVTPCAQILAHILTHTQKQRFRTLPDTGIPVCLFLPATEADTLHGMPPTFYPHDRALKSCSNTYLWSAWYNTQLTTSSPLPAFVVSPLGAVPKKRSGKWHLVMRASYLKLWPKAPTEREQTNG